MDLVPILFYKNCVHVDIIIKMYIAKDFEMVEKR